MNVQDILIAHPRGMRQHTRTPSPTLDFPSSVGELRRVGGVWTFPPPLGSLPESAKSENGHSLDAIGNLSR